MIIEGFVSNSERFLVHWLGFLLFLKHLPCFLYTKLWGSRNNLSYMQAIRMYIVEHLKTITKSTKSQLTFYYHSELAILNRSVVKCPSLATAWPLSTPTSATALLSSGSGKRPRTQSDNCEERSLETICANNNNGRLHPYQAPWSPQQWAELWRAGSSGLASPGHSDNDHDNLSLTGTLLHEDCCGSEMVTRPQVLVRTDSQTQTASGCSWPEWPHKAPSRTGS